MLNVLHFQPHYHTHDSVRDALNMGSEGRRILHEGQNDIWALVEHTTAYSSYPVMLVAHREAVYPFPEIKIDVFKHTYIGQNPSKMELDALLREFIADKRNAIIYAPENLTDETLVDVLIRANFTFSEADGCYVKAPQNY